MQLRSLDPGLVEIWYTLTARAAGYVRTASYLALLCEHERARHDAFRYNRDKHLYRVSHALVRQVLSKYRDVAPADWRFNIGPNGRPEIGIPLDGPRLRFNLSHTDGLAACAVASEADVGVDVQVIDRDLETVSVAQRVLSEIELEDLRSRDGDRQRERFMQYWTLKEAYIKAVGVGMSAPLQSISFHIDSDRTASIAFAWDLDDTPGRWHFWQMRPSDRHFLALAVASVRTNSRVHAIEYVP